MQDAGILERKPQQVEADEFAHLRSVLPSISEGRYTSPIEVIEEAIKYIAHLQATLEDHNSSMSTEDVQQQFRESSTSIKNHIKFKQRRIASFHAKFNMAPKPRTLRGEGRRKRTSKRVEQSRDERTT